MIGYFAHSPFNEYQIPTEVAKHFTGILPQKVGNKYFPIELPPTFYLQPVTPGPFRVRDFPVINPSEFVFPPNEDYLVLKFPYDIATNAQTQFTHYWLYIYVAVKSTGKIYVMEICSSVLNGKIYRTHSADTFEYRPYTDFDIRPDPLTGVELFDNYEMHALDSYTSVQLFAEGTMRNDNWNRRKSFAKIVDNLREPREQEEEQEEEDTSPEKEKEISVTRKAQDKVGSDVLMRNYWRIVEFM